MTELLLLSMERLVDIIEPIIVPIIRKVQERRRRQEARIAGKLETAVAPHPEPRDGRETAPAASPARDVAAATEASATRVTVREVTLREVSIEQVALRKDPSGTSGTGGQE